MPGIVGIIQRESSKGTSGELDRMLGVMRHGWPSREARYESPDLGLVVGIVSHQDSFVDGMVLKSRDGERTLVFHGENFLDDDTVSRLRMTGVHVDENRADYLMGMWEEFGDEFLPRLNGWFCGLLIDSRGRRVTLFNDRYGMSRVYYAEDDHEFIFASEAKALLKVRAPLRELDPQAVAEYIGFQCVTGGRTLFRGISVLPNAAAWEFACGTIPKRRHYFHRRDWEELPPLECGDLYDRFVTTVSRVFPRYTQGRQRVGISLTGGFDTRLILATLPESDREFPCYTFGGTWGETYDISKARQLAAIKGSSFEVVRIGEDYFRDYPTYARQSIFLSDGTHDAFGAHDVYFNATARQIAPIRLTGKFGSEVVRVRKLMPVLRQPGSWVNLELHRRLAALAPLEGVSHKGHDLSGVVFEEIPWCEFGRVAIEQSIITLRTPYMDNELVKLMFQASYQMRASGQMQARFIKERAPELTAILTNLGGMATYNPMLAKLVYLLYRSWFKVEYIYLYATPHWLTRIDRNLERWKPERLFAGRQKFEAYRLWLRTKLSGFVRETLLDSNARYAQFFDKSAVHAMVKRHLAGTHNYLAEINKVLSIELVYSTLLKADE